MTKIFRTDNKGVAENYAKQRNTNATRGCVSGPSLSTQIMGFSGARSSNGQFYHDNETIYSYGPHFPIATRRNINDTQQVVLVRPYDDAPSSTTARHMGMVCSALAMEGLSYIRVKNIHAKTTEEHAENLVFMAEQRELVEGKMERARSPHMRRVHATDYQKWTDNMRRYRSCFFAFTPTTT